MPKGRRTCLRILFCVGVAGLVMWTTGGPRVLTPAPPALSQAETETLLTGLQHNLDQVETLQGAFTVRCEPGDAPWLTEEKDAKTHRAFYRRYWLAIGTRGRFREERLDAAEEGCTGLKISAFDGALRYEWMADNRVGSTAHGLSPNSTVQSEIAGYLGLVDKYMPSVGPAREMIDKKGPLTSLGQEKVDGLDCYKLQAAPPNGGVHTWWIAPDRAFGVKRHVWAFPARLIDAKWDIQTNQWTHTTEEFAEFAGGIWLPTRVTSSFTATTRAGKQYRGDTVTMVVEQLEVNPKLDDGLFAIQFPLSTYVVKDDEPSQRPVPGEFGIRKG